MKRLVLLIFVLCVTLFSCTEDEVVMPNEYVIEVATPNVPTETSDTSEYTEPDKNAKCTLGDSIENALSIDEPFLSILDGKKLFNLNSSQKEISIEEFVFSCYVNAFSENDNLLYANVDMDNDGVNEFVIKDYCGDKLILSVVGENIVGYSFSFRNIDRIYSDGRFSWNYTDYNGLHYGSSRLSFSDNSYSIKNIYSISECTEEYGDELYYIGENIVEKSDYYTYIEQFSDVEIDFRTLK